MIGVKSNTKEFIDKAKIIHGDRYDYSGVNYLSAKNHVSIICKKHGAFSVTPCNHLVGRNCPMCGIDSRSKKFLKPTEKVIIEAKLIWGDRFDYSEIKYIGSHKKCKIKCNICNVVFYQSMDQHINGKFNGCPNCHSNRGWSRSQWIDFCDKKKLCTPTVYIVRLFNNTENFIKIGITSRTTQERMLKIPYEYEILKELKGSALFVYDKEVELHQLYSKFKYNSIKDFYGNRECYSLDIQPLL